MYLKSLPIGSAGYICNMKIAQVLGKVDEPIVYRDPDFLDILYADADNALYVTSEVLPASKGLTPIGLCVAPAGFFGEDEPARWMSLKYMNYTTPDTGSLTKPYMYWGNYQTDISTIDNIQTTYNGGSDYGYLTADWITQTENKIPSLFDANNEWNTSVLGTVNTYAVTDIDGKNKTDKILATATAQPNWVTDTSITNSSGKGYAPAACCCARYHTLGTQAGDWYLGAAGEMSMIVVKRDEIDTKLAAINAVYPNDCVSSLARYTNWTSTENLYSYAYSVSTSNGSINHNYKNNNGSVVAMLKTVSTEEGGAIYVPPTPQPIEPVGDAQLFADPECMQYATGELGDNVYVRFNKRVVNGFNATSDDVRLQFILVMPDYSVALGTTTKTYYQINTASSIIEEGTVIELTKKISDTLNVANPLIWTE